MPKKGKVAERSIWGRKKWAEKIVEKLKEGHAAAKEFVKIGIPERSAYRTLKALKIDGIVKQKEKYGKYFLSGYEEGPPNTGKTSSNSFKIFG